MVCLERRDGLYCRIQNAPHIVDMTEIGQEGTEVGQFRIMRVVEPRRYGDGVVGVENIGCGRVVKDDRILDWAAQL